MRLLISFSFFGSISITHANICEIENSYLVSKREIQGTPNYFFRTFPDRDMVSYNESIDDDYSNILLDLVTGTRVEIPGPYDPVPTWDERLVTTPEHEGFAFYDTNKLLSGDSASVSLVYRDESMIGVYQSIGNLRKNGSRIRVITDEENLSFRDYEVSYSSREIRVSPMGSKRSGCPDQDIQLPMLSKDGQYIAARDMNFSPPTTRIFRMKDDGQCTLIKDLGVQAGKVDFSFDGTKLVFHQSVDTVEGVEYFDSPTTVQDIFVYDLETDETRKITNNSADKTSYYPVWRRDGSIVYIDRDENGTFAFSVADPDKIINGERNNEMVGDDCRVQQEALLQDLGEMWIDVCVRSNNDDAENAILTALSLDNKKCRELIDEHWSNLETKARDRQLVVSKESYYNICLDREITTIEKAHQQEPEEINVKKFLQVKCAMCHGDILADPNRETTLASSQSKNWLEEAINRMNSSDETYKMPIGSSLEVREKEEISKYLRELVE